MQIIWKRLLADRTLQLTGVFTLLALAFGNVHWSDINAHTIIALAALMMLVSVYETEGLLVYVASTVVSHFQTTRQIIRVTFLMAFFGSMLFTNDVAILTLVPIFVTIARKIQLKMILPLVFMTIFANLGSAVTPFGNPQNLYLASFYQLPALDFFKMSLPLGMVSLGLLFLVTYLFANDTVGAVALEKHPINKRHMVVVLLVTVVVLAAILNALPIGVALIASGLLALGYDRTTFVKIDYGVLLLFVGFFVIVGALSRVTVLASVLTHLTDGPIKVFFAGILTSQVISNVPGAILLSKFTHLVYPLYLGVSIGGLGTIIASLANLLAWRQYQLQTDEQSWSFPTRSMLINVLLLLIFIPLGLLLLKLN